MSKVNINIDAHVLVCKNTLCGQKFILYAVMPDRSLLEQGAGFKGNETICPYCGLRTLEKEADD